LGLNELFGREESTPLSKNKGATHMREDTTKRKRASRCREIEGGRRLAGWVVEIVRQGKREVDRLVIELGRMVGEAVM